jgi:hypothetical protein
VQIHLDARSSVDDAATTTRAFRQLDDNERIAFRKTGGVDMKAGERSCAFAE